MSAKIPPSILTGVKITREQYDAIDAVRATELKLAAKSLFHFNEAKTKGIRVSGSKQKGYDLGTLSHAINLEDDISQIVMFDGKKKNGDEYASPRSSKLFEEMVAQNPNKIVITKSEFKALVEKRAAFFAGKGVADLIKGCEFEVAFCAQDPVTGLWLKCLADLTNMKERRFGDLKGCPDASEFGVAKMAARAKWPIQIGHYAYVIELATGIKMERFDFVGQEFAFPYYAEAHELSRMDMENCALNYRELLNRLSVAIKEDTWPGYKKRGALVLPPWAYEFEEIETDWSVA